MNRVLSRAWHTPRRACRRRRRPPCRRRRAGRGGPAPRSRIDRGRSASWGAKDPTTRTRPPDPGVTAVASRPGASSVIVPPSLASPPPRAPSSLTHRYVAWTLRHGRLLWSLAVLLAIPAAWRTASLYRNLRSEVEELLPRDAPSVIAIEELRARMAGLQYLGVVVGLDARAGGRLADGQRLSDELAARGGPRRLLISRTSRTSIGPR